MSAATVANQLCVYFGGAYDPTTRTYRTPQLQIPGVAMGTVRRAKPKYFDAADYYLGAAGVGIGFQTYILLHPGDEVRVGFGGATSGLKQVRHEVYMACLLRCASPYAEDALDAQYAIQQAVSNRIHSDRTCGSGGIEAGGFQVGEGNPPRIRWFPSDVVSFAERTEAVVHIEFNADEFIIA